MGLKMEVEQVKEGKRKWKNRSRNITFSLPAKSTRKSFPLSFCSVCVFSCLTFIRKILWLLELCSFMSDTHTHHRENMSFHFHSTSTTCTQQDTFLIVKTSQKKSNRKEGSETTLANITQRGTGVEKFSLLKTAMQCVWLICMGLLVTATCLLDLPSSMVSITSSGLHTNRSVQPCRWRKR